MMKWKRYIFYTHFLLICTAVLLCVGAKNVNQLESLQAIYEKSLNKIKSDHNRETQALYNAYIKALKGLQKNLRGKGDLIGLIVVRKELSRFETDREISEKALVTSPREVRNLQVGYQKRTKKYAIKKANNIVSLSRKYLRYLQNLQEKFTMKGGIDDALSVKQEIERVEASPELAAADFEIVEYQASQELADSDWEKEPSGWTDPDDDDGDDEPSVVKTDRYKIYRGKKPPPVSGLRFKKLMLRPTPNIRTGQKVTINVTLANDEQVTKDNRSNSYWSNWRSKSGSVSHFLRVSVKSKTRAYVVKNATVVIQFFSKNASKKGKLRPQKMSTEHIKLSRLTTDTIYLDMAPVTTHKSSYRYTSWHYHSRSDSGNQFYGVIVSVFDGDDTLVAQQATTSKLTTLASPELIE